MVGDLVNTTGAVAWLRQAFPDAQFVLEGGAAARELFPDIEVWVRKRHSGLLGKLQRVSSFRRGRFDMAVVLDDSREAARLARMAGIPKVYAPDPTSEGHDLFAPLFSVLQMVNAAQYVENQKSKIKNPTLSEGNLKPVLPLSASHREAADQYLENQKSKIENPTLLHVGASDIAKQWPEANWIELAKQVDCMIAGGPGEEALVQRIAEAAGRPALPVLPLLVYAAVLERASLLITSDTGPAHLAAAVGTRAIVLYGPTDPVRFHPWGTNWVALRHPMGCDHYGPGCAFLSRGECTQKCMGAITPGEVAGRLAG